MGSKKTKSETRVLTEKIQALTGQTAILINYQANQFIETGLCDTRVDALDYILTLAKVRARMPEPKE